MCRLYPDEEAPPESSAPFEDLGFLDLNSVPSEAVNVRYNLPPPHILSGACGWIFASWMRLFFSSIFSATTPTKNQPSYTKENTRGFTVSP